MNIPTMTEVKPIDDMNLIVTFEGGKKKKYDMKKLFIKWPIFKELQNNDLFKSVKLDVGGYGIVWNKDIDLSYYEIWDNGEDYKD